MPMGPGRSQMTPTEASRGSQHPEARLRLPLAPAHVSLGAWLAGAGKVEGQPAALTRSPAEPLLELDPGTQGRQALACGEPWGLLKRPETADSLWPLPGLTELMVPGRAAQHVTRVPGGLLHTQTPEPRPHLRNW